MNNNLKPVNIIPPFKRLCMSIGELPTSYLETMTYYEMLVWFTEYMKNTVIPTINNNAEAVSELQAKYIELKSFVDTYFDNLDVQEEVNNKLDEMAEDGSLEYIIEQYAREKVEYIFPKFWSDEPSQDCSIIKGYNKNIVIDCGRSQNWNNILLMMINNNVSHIDYFILSHYDPDHVGNLQNLVNNHYIDENTNVYLPIVPDRYSSFQATETTIKNMLDTNNINYTTPTENYILNINDYLTIKFGNLNKQYMEDNYYNYNFCSMVCLVTHKQNSVFYAGDIGSPSFEYLDSINFINHQVDLYKQAHHGIDLIYTYPQFIQHISPKYTVQEGGITDFGRDIYQCPETSLLKSLGSLYFPTYMIKDYVKFESDGSNLVNKVGINCSFSNRNVPLTLYVNINAVSTDIQDGTQEHPFKELGQALGYIYKFPVGDVTINLADGSYGLETNEVDNIAQLENINIIINGNENDKTAVILDNLQIYNGNITFQNLTINSSKNTYAIRFDNSSVSLKNCKITSSYTTATNGIGASKSKIYIENCEFNTLNYAINGYETTTITFGSTNTYTNVNYKIQENPGTIINPFVIPFTYDEVDNKLILEDNYEHFNIIEIFATYNDHSSSIKIINPVNHNYAIEIPYISFDGNSYGHYVEDLRFRSLNVIWLMNPRSIEITNTGTISYNELPDNLTINKIVGYIY